MREQVSKFEKFIQENDAKRSRYIWVRYVWTTELIYVCIYTNDWIDRLDWLIDWLIAVLLSNYNTILINYNTLPPSTLYHHIYQSIYPSVLSIYRPIHRSINLPIHLSISLTSNIPYHPSICSYIDLSIFSTLSI